jgi:pre-mRNA-splicing helicase BRR2
VPALKPKPYADGEKLVAIAELPDWAQAAFKGMENLNRVQSRVSDTALYSSENMLVCAPTGACARAPLCGRGCVCFGGVGGCRADARSLVPPGLTPPACRVTTCLAGAGKTNVAMLCVMHELGLHRRSDGSIDTAAFKIVYVAPMKALVAEMVGNFTARLGEAYGLKVRELTGARARGGGAGGEAGSGDSCAWPHAWRASCSRRRQQLGACVPTRRLSCCCCHDCGQTHQVTST